MCQMVYFCAKTNQFYSSFLGGGQQTPLLHISYTILILYCVEQKKI